MDFIQESFHTSQERLHFPLVQIFWEDFDVEFGSSALFTLGNRLDKVCDEVSRVRRNLYGSFVSIAAPHLLRHLLRSGLDPGVLP